MPSPAVMEQPYVVMDFIQLFTGMILVVMEESKKPEGRRRQNFLVVRRVARAFRLAVEAAICFWLLHGVLLCVCLAWTVLMLFEDLEIDSVQHINRNGGECNHNEVESYVVGGSHMVMYRIGQGLAVGSGYKA